MNVFLIVDAAIGAIILVLHVMMCVGVGANLRKEKRLAAIAADRPAAAGDPAAAEGLRAEVVVALRNEEEALPRLLDSLRHQTCTDCSFLFVDDRSSDATARLLDAFCAEQGSRARVLHKAAEPDGLTGKQAALDQAFQRIRGDVILLTDGDCVLPPSWVEEMLRHFLDPAVGVVLGRVELPPGRNFLERFQAFEQPLLNQYNLGSAGMGMPTGCFGSNMALRASAVSGTGGFAALGYSVTEDALLLDAVARAGGWKVAVCSSETAAALTSAQPSWKEYVDQHTRWNAGGLFSPDIVTRLSYLFIVLFYLVGSILVSLLGFIDWRVPVLSLNAFLSIGLLAVVSGLYPGKKRLPYFVRLLPYLFFFGFFYSFVTLRAFIRRPFEWKGASLRP